MNFYKHFIGDYQRDTGHLSLMEHGAYRLMLDTFYATQKPLPKERRMLYRLLRADGLAERRAIDSVVSQFWSATAKGLVNLRAEVEIGKAQKQAEVNRQIAFAREEKRRLEKWHSGAKEAESMPFSAQSGSCHVLESLSENQVYEVSKADGSSMPEENQAINGAKRAKNINKDAFMAIFEGEAAVSGGWQGVGKSGVCAVFGEGDDAPVFMEGESAHDPDDVPPRKTGDETACGKKGGAPDVSGREPAGGGAFFCPAELAGAMRKAGIEAQAADPRIMALAGQGISPGTVRAACEEAKRARPGERIGPVYIVRIVERWAKEAAAIAAHGARAQGKAARGGIHAERKRVVEELTGKRLEDGQAASLTIEGAARLFDADKGGGDGCAA